jgi:hypothetical protein
MALTSTTKIYLDIDGTLVTKEGEPAKHLPEFLEYITKNYSCFWLTTHSHGEIMPIKLYLSRLWPKALLHYIDLIKPTAWDTWKTEAIDFSGDFFWLDDFVFDYEQEVLRKQNKESSLIKINLNTNPNQLRDILTNSLLRKATADA